MISIVLFLAVMQPGMPHPQTQAVPVESLEQCWELAQDFLAKRPDAEGTYQASCVVNDAAKRGNS